MTFEQLVTLFVLAGVIVALIWDKVRADVVALAGAALLLLTGAVRPSEVQGAFGSPAIIALASLFVIAHAMELSGLLDLLIAFPHAASTGAISHMAAQWYVPVFAGPPLVISHVACIVLLVRRGST